ncbi:rhodanese-related sulfurtransferase [Pyruvatibacter sp.]|uniref:oxygen-dependent tRNA uridine(34) hydroxylase TrhO n=1 Tax=Pyruvatibacter sp. TaxID=1981328 RepID=UPI0032EE736D
MHSQTQTDGPFKVAALYHFVVLDDPAALRPGILAACQANGLKGTILLANEGINGTVAGKADGVDAVIAELAARPEFQGLEVKYSSADAMPFLRLKVRLKKEIVTLGVAGVDAANGKGDYVDPTHWNAMLADPDTVVIDTRNAYEVAIGTFEGAINPGTENFRDFPAWFDDFAKTLRKGTGTPPKIAMFCTGGIRCEKATAYVKTQGFDDVHHLKGGILKYLENVPEDESRWNGECFVFDQRVAVKHGLEEGDYDQCHACRMPLSPQEMTSDQYVPGISCPHCHDTRTEAQRERYRERQRQIENAAQRGRKHLGSP